VGPGERWIEVKILPGTLTAYEGTVPVYATLISPGKGGVPVPGQDHTKYTTTAIGSFPIEWKDHVDTMSSEPREPTVMWFTDVPHIQYLKAPLAMHVAMWHEDFGNPKSAECVNVSPEDGRFLFGWTSPALPEGWGGIRPGDGNGKSTTVVVTAR
jgi:lipoprotein-anchoring transpeptidase ErfK/SrfK